MIVTQKVGTKGVTSLIFLVVIAIIIDTSIINTATSIGGLTSSEWSLPIFILMFMIFAVGQYIILDYTKREYLGKNKIDKIRPRLDLLYKVVVIAQYLLISLLFLMIIEMISTSTYHIILLKLVIGINYGLALSILAILARYFYSWYRRNRNAVVLAYALAVSIISINAFITIGYAFSEYVDDPQVINPIRSLTGTFASTTASTIFSVAYITSSVIAFILTWIATVLLLRYYSRRIGRIKYWIIVGIPLTYFISQFQPLFIYSFAEFRLSDPVLFGIIYNLIFTISKPAGGILFGIAFWLISRRIADRTVKGYLILSAYGMILLFAANQPVGLILTPYPPFGLITISFMSIASYLVFLGIYSSSMSVSEDSRLRQSIRNIAIEESRFLQEIGTAQMELEIERKVMLLSNKFKRNIIEETGIKPSLTDEEIREYLEQVINEIKPKNKEKS